MKLLIGLAFLSIVWAIPLPEENLNPQELQDVIPADDLNIFAGNDEKEAAANLPQLKEVVGEEVNGKSFVAPAYGVPIIEPLNGLEDINAENSIQDDFDEVSADEVPDVAILSPFIEDEEEVKSTDLFESDSDEKSPLDEIQIVDLDSNDVHGFMGIAPSELDSIRVYFNEDMAHELNYHNEQAPQIIRLNNNDPNLR